MGCSVPASVAAADEESYAVFKEMFDPVVFGWHNYKPTDSHKTDLDPTHIRMTDEQAAKFNEFVVSTRIRAGQSCFFYLQ